MKSDELFEVLNGRKVVHNGIEGVLRYRVTDAVYPYPHTIHRLSHEATAKGKRSAQYQEIRARLRDDWETDLTDAPESLLRICAVLKL